MADKEFYIDPRTKLGGEVEWEAGDEFSKFVDMLNRGVTVRADGVEGVAELPRENQLDALSVSELRAIFANYR